MGKRNRKDLAVKYLDWQQKYIYLKKLLDTFLKKLYQL